MTKAYYMPETAAADVGPVAIEVLQLAGRDVQLARPAKPERLLDLVAVADAYGQDEYMPYWATLWPVSRYLSEVILAEPWPAGLKGIELGCGLGLPGVAGLLAGIDVAFTDYDRTALRFAAENARLNGFPAVRTVAVDWREPPPERFDVIIASDLLYEKRNTLPLIASFEALLAPGGTVMLADQDRAYADEFRSALQARGFVYEARAFRGDVPGTVYKIKRP